MKNSCQVSPKSKWFLTRQHGIFEKAENDLNFVLTKKVFKKSLYEQRRYRYYVEPDEVFKTITTQCTLSGFSSCHRPFSKRTELNSFSSLFYRIQDNDYRIGRLVLLT